MGSTNAVIPRCLGTSQFVRASSSPKSAVAAPVDQTFCPVTSQSSPSRSALVVSPARSEPAPGSLNSWHQVISPVTVGRMNRRLRSSLPCSTSTGAASIMPRPSGGPGTTARLSSAATTRPSSAGSDRPHHSRGQVGQAQP